MSLWPKSPVVDYTNLTPQVVPKGEHRVAGGRDVLRGTEAEGKKSSDEASLWRRVNQAIPPE